MAKKPEAITTQRDFSAGQIDLSMRRADDHPLFKAGVRQASNWRILNSRGVTNRPGRTALFLDGARVEAVRMSPTNLFYLVFGNGYLRVYNAAGAQVFNTTNTIPWTTATVGQVSWDVIGRSIYICFGYAFRPRILSWDGVSQTSTWAIGLFTEFVAVGTQTQKRTVFARLAEPGITLQPSDITGNITLQFSSPTGVAAPMSAVYNGQRLLFAGRQLIISAVTSVATANATCSEVLFSGWTLTNLHGINAAQYYFPEDVVIGRLSGARGTVWAASGATIFVQSLSATDFIAGEGAIGPNGAAYFEQITKGTPWPTTVWSEEIFGDIRGYPASVFADQGRLGFCDFPAKPGLIVWSAVGIPNDLYTDENNAGATNAIQEIIPGQDRAMYVVPGMNSDEFVFSDHAVYQVPITVSNPLQPGSVAFNEVSADGCAAVQPRRAQQSIVYVSAGSKQIRAVQALGANNRPYIVDDVSTLHEELFSTPVALAVPSGSDQFEERYIYVLNSDGTIVVGHYEFNQGMVDKAIGWVPWSGVGSATWIAGFGSDVTVTSVYQPSGAVSRSVVERVDATKWLDASVLYNAVPTALTPAPGLGPLWWIAGGTVEVMDGLRPMGTYTVDADGFLVPQHFGGEDLTSLTLLCGQSWTATLEPFIPMVQPGQDVGQRLTVRRIARVITHVANSSGFVVRRLYTGQTGPDLPAIGTVMKERRFPAYNMGEDATLPPPLRNQAYIDRPLGRAHDPRWQIVKDTAGPLEIVEISTEVTA